MPLENIKKMAWKEDRSLLPFKMYLNVLIVGVLKEDQAGEHLPPSIEFVGKLFKTPTHQDAWPQ